VNRSAVNSIFCLAITCSSAHLAVERCVRLHLLLYRCCRYDSI